jgi:hypothetical protein
MANVAVKTITQSEINTLKYMFGTFPESTRKTLIENQCAKYKITTDFVREFKEYITKQSFSTSPELTSEMIFAHNDLFDYNVWKNNKNKTLQPLLDDTFVEKYVGTDSIEDIILLTEHSALTVEMFNKYFEKLGNNVKSLAVNSSQLTTEELVRTYPDLVNEKIFSNKHVKFEWTNSLIEHILNNKQLNTKFLISILSKTKDFGFMEEMLNRDFNYVQSGGTFDEELKTFLFNLPADYYGLIFDVVAKNSPNALTYSVLERVLDFNDFLSEQFLIENVEHFNRAGLFGKLAEYARRNEYKALMVMLRLS